MRYAGTSTFGTGATADTLLYLDQININTISGIPSFGVQLNDVSKPNGATYISGGYKLTVSDANSSAAGSIVSTLANSPGVSISSGGNNVAFDSSKGTTVTNTTQRSGQGIVMSTSGTGTITVTVGGAVLAYSQGIDATTAGSGLITITANAPVTSIASSAVYAQSGGGGIVLTTNATVTGDYAVDIAAAAGGAITYNANATVVGSNGAIRQLTYDGANTLIVSNGATIDGGSGSQSAITMLSGGSGDIAVTTAAGTVVRSATSDGIDAFALGGTQGSSTVTVNGSVVAHGSAINAETNTGGTVTVAVGSSGVLSTDRAYGQSAIDAEVASSIEGRSGSSPRPSGNVVVTLDGQIKLSGYAGIDAAVAGDGTIAVTTNAGSLITGTTGAGIRTRSSGTGATTITAATGSQINGVDGNGIEADATGGGAISISAGGNIAVTNSGADAIQANAAGGSITIGTTGTVITSAAGAAVHIANTANTTANVLNNDTTLLGAGSQSGSAFADWEPTIKITTTTGSTTINNDTVAAGTGVIGSDIGALAIAASGGSVTMNNAGPLNGRVDFSNLTGRAALNNTNAWILTGTSAFSPGADTLNNAATGVITMSGTTAVAFGAGNDTLTNAGAINAGDSAAAVSTLDFGDGTDAAANSGTITARGSAVLAHLETFSNSGALDLQADGALTDTLKMAGAAFDGTGASTLKIDAALGNQTQTACTAPSIADCMVIGAASGSTAVNVHDTLAGSPGYYNPTGILVVDSTGGSPSAFVLAGSNVTADPAEPGNGAYIQKDFYDYYLKPNATTGDWMLIGAPGRALYQINKIGSGLQTVWNETARDVTDRTVELRDALMTRNGPSAEVDRFSVWVHGGYGRFTRASTDSYELSTGGSLNYTDGYGQTLSDAIGGIDFTHGSGGGAWALGVFGGYGTSNMDFKSSTTRVRLSGENAGAYVSYMHRDLFASLIGKADRSRVHLEAPSVPFDQEFNATTYGGIFEFGAHVVENDFFFEPLGSVSYSTSTLDSLSAYATTLAFKGTSSIKGRLGLRFGASLDTGNAGFAQPYVSIASVEEFAGRNALSIASGTESLDITDNPSRTSGELGAGVDFVEGGGLSGYLRGETIFNGITVNGYTVRAGLRWVF